MAASIPFQRSSAEAIFEEELRSKIKRFKLFENETHRAKALEYVPLQDLLAIAQAKYDSCDKPSDSKVDGGKVVQDMLLLELMDWFKNEFFTWMNSPPCPHCQKPTQGIGSAVPTPLELAMSAGRVEIYTCTSCFSDKREVARFPRYNNPVTLLTTRTGRCGEWANCFALILRAVGFEVRHVHDYTDHVWLEVYSCGMFPNRWVHVDPCENSYDNPLLYEVGWGKKLTYIIAVSQDDIQDVTPRYSKLFDQVLSRRREVSEEWLVKKLITLRQEMQQNLPENRKKELQTRWVQEIVELITSKDRANIKDSEKVGRESGSLAWRLARQELGSTTERCTAKNGYIWEIGENFIFDGRFELAYDSDLDTYVRKDKSGKDVFVKGWENGVFAFENMFRKEEQDWKMVYLATRENSRSSKVCWKFHLEPGCAFEDVVINLKYSIFQSDAQLLVKVACDQSESKTILETNSGDKLFTWESKSSTDTGLNSQLQKSSTFRIECELRSGSGSQGWQKAQLFRQQVTAGKPLSAVSRNILNIGFKIKKL